MKTEQEWTAAVLEVLGTTLGTLIDAPVEAAASTITGRAWSVRLGIAGAPQVTLAFDETGAAALVGAVHGPDKTSSHAVICQTLEEVCNNTASALAGSAPGAGEPPEITRPELVAWVPPPGATTQAFTSAGLPAALMVSIVTTARTAAGAIPPASSRSAAGADPSAHERLAVLLDIELPLVVRFGCTDMPLKALARLGPGSIIDLGRAPDDPVEVLVGNRVVARGEVVVVAGSYGIRIVDVVSQRERLRELEA